MTTGSLFRHRRLRRPTTAASGHKSRFPFERSGRHWQIWVGYGDVAIQVQLRVWRVEWDFTIWRSYEP